MQENLSAESFLTLAQAAEKLQVSVSTCRRYVKSGVVPATKFGGKNYRIPVKGLLDLAQRVSDGVPVAPAAPKAGKRARSTKLVARARKTAK